MVKVSIPMRLPSCNEYINASRISKGKWNAGNALKKRTQEEIGWYLKKLPKFEKPIRITFIWVSEPSDRRDLDGISFGKKFILDAMQEAELIANDNWRHIRGIKDTFVLDRKNPRIVVNINLLNKKEKGGLLYGVRQNHV